MITNPLLEEIWGVKDRLNTESGGDIHVFCQQLRGWFSKNQPCNMVVYDPAKLRALIAKEDPEPLKG
jgi:hypothetical protein